MTKFQSIALREESNSMKKSQHFQDINIKAAQGPETNNSRMIHLSLLVSLNLMSLQSAWTAWAPVPLFTNDYGREGFWSKITFCSALALVSVYSTRLLRLMGTSIALTLGCLCTLAMVVTVTIIVQSLALTQKDMVEGGDNEISIGFRIVLLFVITLNGAGLPLLAVAAGQYMFQCTKQDKRDRYIGVFWSIVSMGILLSYVTSGVVLSTDFSVVAYLYIMDIAAISSVVMAY
jgi:hypothetical protein